MRDIYDPRLNARLTIDDDERIRDINHEQRPWRSRDETPVKVAIAYMRHIAAVLAIGDTELLNIHQQVSFAEPRQQGIEYRLGSEKQILDSTTIIFNQTYLNVPV